MNSGAMRIHSKGHFQGGIQIKNEKNRPSLKYLKTDNRPEKSKYKPLWGKVFYLDLPSVTISEKLQKDIKDLGGRVEEFLSKDISYLISNKKEAKFAQTLGQISPVPSPESAYTAETTSPHPSHDGSSFKSPDTVCLSRGKLLVEKAIKDHDFIPSNSILSNALSWGVKILHIDDIRYYIEQKKKELYLLKKSSTSVRDGGKRIGTGAQKARTGRLKKPFVKIEDISQCYRPFYLQLTNMPFINYSIQKPCSPFDVEKPSSMQKQTQVKLRIQMDGDKYGGTSVQLQLKEKKKKGYCECCLQKYEDLETHLLSEQHRNFAQSNRYQVVDDIVSKLVFDFVECEKDTPKKKRIKYNVGSLSPVSANALKKDTLLFPAKDLKEKDLHSVFAHDSCLITINSSQEHLTAQAKAPSHTSPEEPNKCDIKNMDSLPCGKIHRKVKILLGRNRKENLEPNAEFDKRTEFITQEENKICSSPVQSLLDLFQTSEEKSEFLGFTSYSENSSICNVLDIWEEENSNNLLTMFFSSPSTSTFTGF
uniref:Protein DBF4 homolog A n=1 Tax=Saimiri boliviensis boliviensis TaxID=39432 RepID=A0A2K6USV6_SAIBB